MNRKNTLFLILIILALIILKIPHLDRSEFWVSGGDESRHAMNGVFIMDFIKDKPFSDPISYTKNYYGRYPALSLQRNPPLFYLVEAFFFVVLGITVYAANMPILVLFIIGIFFWFKLLERKFNGEIAFLSCLLFIMLRNFLYYYNSVMLEVPLLSIMFIFLYFFDNYLELKKLNSLSASVFFLIIAFLINQKAIIFLFFTIIVLLLKKLETSPKKHKILIGFFINLLALFFLIIIIFLSCHLFENNKLIYKATYLNCAVNLKSLFSVSRIAYYMKGIPKQIGWILTAFLAMGIFDIVRKKQLKKYYFFLVLLFWIYALQISIIKIESLRFVFYGLPFLTLLAVTGIDFFINGIEYLNNKRILVYLIIILLVSISGFNYRKPYINGYEEVAKYVIQHNKENNPILTNINRNGNFIFFIRKYDTRKQQMVIRSERFLYLMTGYDVFITSYVKDENDILSKINSAGIKYIVVDEDVSMKENKLLHKLLRNTSKFKIVYKKRIDTNIPPHLDVRKKLVNEGALITVYEYLESRAPEQKKLILPITDIGVNFEVDIQNRK